VFGRLRFFVLLSLIGSLSSACSTSNRQPPPFEIHSAQAISTHHLGTPLSGPVIGKESTIVLADSLDIHITWFSLEKFNCRDLPLVASEATLVTAKLADQAVLPSTALTGNARIGWFKSADANETLLHANPSRYFQIGQSRSALPFGATASFRIIETGGAADQTLGHPEPRYVELAIARIPSASPGKDEDLQIALGIEDSASLSDSHDWPASVYQHETALLDHPLKSNATSLLVIVPFAFVGPFNQAVAAFVTISPAGKDPAFQKALARCKSDFDARASASANPLWTLGLLRALRELDDSPRRRAALVYLADQGGASLCQDVAMLANDALLQTIALSVKQDAPTAISDGNQEQYAWILDRSAIAAMQPLLTKATLPPELFTVLTEHFGEPGRHAAAVDEIMHGSSNGHELQQRLISENYIYLEDSSPAARVRAFEWLTAQKLAPAGFDPLGSPKQRRQALDQALSNPPAGAPIGGAQ